MHRPPDDRSLSGPDRFVADSELASVKHDHESASPWPFGADPLTRHRRSSEGRLRDGPMKIAIVCACLGVLVFSPSLWGAYPLDDEFIATPFLPSGDVRPLVGQLGSLGEYFSTHWWFGHYAATELFRPITKLTLGLTHAVWVGGLGWDAAFGQHLVNLGIYAWCCALVPVLISRLTNSKFCAVTAGVAFAVHTVHSEAVCTLTGRAELLAFALGLQASILTMRVCDSRTRGRASSMAILLSASLLFFTAFGSKESALAWAPVVLCLVGWRCGRRPAVTTLAAAIVPAGIAFFVLRAQMIASLPDAVAATNAYANPLVELGVVDRIVQALEILGFGLGRVLFPIRLSVDHGRAVFDLADGLFDVGTLLSILVISIAIAGAWRCRRSAPLFSFAVFTYACFVFLTSNLAFPIGTIYAERLLFAPSLALALGVAAVAAVIERRGLYKPALLVPLSFWVAHCAVYSFRRSAWFADTATIAQHDVRVQPRSANLQRLASAAFVAQGDRGSAIEALEEARKLEPKFAATWLNLAALVREAGDTGRALSLLREAIPTVDRAQTRERAMLHASLATSLAARGDVTGARRELLTAIELDPASTDYPKRLERLDSR